MKNTNHGTVMHLKVKDSEINTHWPQIRKTLSSVSAKIQDNGNFLVHCQYKGMIKNFMLTPINLMAFRSQLEEAKITFFLID